MHAHSKGAKIQSIHQYLFGSAQAKAVHDIFVNFYYNIVIA
jgi:hypothetical protein